MNALKNIKKNIIRMAHYSHASHVGCALSIADILYVLYANIANINISNISSHARDRVLLSKGHASTALYATLAEFGLLDKDFLDRYYIDGGILPGHLDRDASPAIDISAGSLGHGLSIGIGMAIADKNHNVYVIVGDGECNEGSVWEAIMLLGTLKLTNLILIIDKNNLQGFNETAKVIDYSKLKSTLENWGLDATEINGHDLYQIKNALMKRSGKTKAIIANTIKGCGVSFMENELKWHYKSPNDVELNIAYKELDK